MYVVLQVFDLNIFFSMCIFRLRDEDSGSGSEEPKEKSLTTFKDVEPGPGEHPLQYTYCFWYSKKPPGRSQDPSSFERNMKIVGTFRSVSLIIYMSCKKGQLRSLVQLSLVFLITYLQLLLDWLSD